MKFIKKNAKYIILIFICIVGSIIYSFCVNPLFHKKNSIKTNSSPVMGDAQSGFMCLTGYTNYNQRLSTIENDLIDTIYPVGSIYVSATNTNPSTLFGGTWVAFAEGKNLVGVDSNDTDFDTVEETGGAKAQTLTTANLPSHTHDYGMATSTKSTTLTTADIPSHTHTINGITVKANGTGSSYLVLKSNSVLELYKRDGTVLWTSDGTTYTSTASTHKVVTLGKGSTTTDTMSSGGGGHSHTITNTTVSMESTGEENPTEIPVQDPYIVVYMWKRTA